jgi:ubiquinone/menaquinone biosynthesis C-methylase UbiE
MEIRTQEDKNIERLRYDARALSVESLVGTLGQVGGSTSICPELRDPYIRYEGLISEGVRADTSVLEIGAGTGEFTYAALQAGAKVTAIDISSHSIDLMRRRHAAFSESLTARVADMEHLPFEDASFDFVMSAGSLSYGDNLVVLAEIYRVLKPGGRFICVDSLNHNPIYRANRWIHFLRDRRSRSTLLRMPTLSLIDCYRQSFGQVRVEFYGSLAWLMPIVALVVGSNRARYLSNGFDRTFRISRSAFKFVMVATKKSDNDRRE